MVLKVSINLPGDTVITFEADEPQLCREVLAVALKELPRDILRLHGDGVAAVEAPAPENGTSGAGPAVHAEEPEPPSEVASSQAANRRAAEVAFGRFCLSIAPMGDMRRTVVAAEGARRYLGTVSVSGKELGQLFDLAGWTRPADFLQTLRNAARSKFGWLERVPGKSGYYIVTSKGRAQVIGAAA